MLEAGHTAFFLRKSLVTTVFELPKFAGASGLTDSFFTQIGRRPLHQLSFCLQMANCPLQFVRSKPVGHENTTSGEVASLLGTGILARSAGEVGLGGCRGNHDIGDDLDGRAGVGGMRW